MANNRQFISNLNSELVEEKEIDVGSVLQNKQTVGIRSRFYNILASQRRNLKNLSALVVFNFLAAGLFFLAQVKIANVIGKEQFGLLAYGIALGMYGQAIVRYGMDRTLVRDLIHYPNRFAELVMASLLLRGLLLGLIVAGLVIWKLVLQSTDLSWPVIAVVVAYSLKSLDLQPVYDAWHCMARHAVYNMIQRGLYFVLIWAVILVAPQSLSMLSISLALLATEIFYLLLQQRWAFQRINFRTIKDSLRIVAADLSKSNFWVWLASMVALSFGSLNQIILKYYCGAAELGGYAASWQIASAATLLFTQVARIGKPATARKTRGEISKKERIHFLLRYSWIMLLTAAPICIPAFIFPEVVLKMIFKPEYVLAAGILRTLSVYMVIYSIGLIASQYVISARMEKSYFVSIIIGGILGVTLYLVLIPSMGSFGAALALLIAHGTSMGLYWITMIQHVRKQR